MALTPLVPASDLDQTIKLITRGMPTFANVAERAEGVVRRKFHHAAQRWNGRSHVEKIGT